MQISRLVIRNFRAFEFLDVAFPEVVSCVIGENNAGKTALIRAIQICLDVSLPSMFRSLVREDIYSGVNIGTPSQVLIGVELSGFEGHVNEEALVSTWKLEPDRARLFYRFRPRLSVREALSRGEREPGNLTLEDYAWEIKGGGDPGIDLADIVWDDDEVGEVARFSDLQSYLVVHLAALRDVESDLRNSRASPLMRLIEACDIDRAEQDALIAILNEANTKIDRSPTISGISAAIDESFKTVSGPAFEMDLSLGLSAATFQSIIRNLKVLLSNTSLADFEPARNGLGMNNILYISILMEYLKRRVARLKSAGQIILIEEPEAHLHPQLQASLLIALQGCGVQVILTSHSTQVTSQAPFGSLVSLTKCSDSRISGSTLASNPRLSASEIADLERYLDSTKSNLLYARKVMLVEGPAELFLIPAIVEAVHGVHLERLGISVVAIYGVHFEVYAKLFCEGSLEKRCAIVADADLAPSDAGDDFEMDLLAPELTALRNEYVEVFLGATTFERELVSEGTLPMLIAAMRDLGAPRAIATLEAGLERLRTEFLTSDETQILTQEIGGTVLAAAKRFGKARFAQVAARHANLCTDVPPYIQRALDWLQE